MPTDQVIEIFPGQLIVNNGFGQPDRLLADFGLREPLVDLPQPKESGLKILANSVDPAQVQDRLPPPPQTGLRFQKILEKGLGFPIISQFEITFRHLEPDLGHSEALGIILLKEAVKMKRGDVGTGGLVDLAQAQKGLFGLRSRRRPFQEFLIKRFGL